MYKMESMRWRIHRTYSCNIFKEEKEENDQKASDSYGGEKTKIQPKNYQCLRERESEKETK